MVKTVLQSSPPKWSTPFCTRWREITVKNVPDGAGESIGHVTYHGRETENAGGDRARPKSAN